jgi:hypothetical protein
LPFKERKMDVIVLSDSDGDHKPFGEERKMDAIVLCDSDEDHKPFGVRSKKHKIDSDSEDKYEPPCVKGKKKIKMDTKCGTSKKGEKRPTAPKERKPRTVTKRTAKKNKAFKEESKNEVCICVSVVKLYVQIQVFWDMMICCLVYICPHFGGACCCCLQGGVCITLKMEAASCSDISVAIY